ncbi:hypothetical protein DL96DRAFT_1814167 [Flagelloscypha sp. PMI_526]|nr:hypothetical protein DL96DRAFT_1814167 [Flagelloscypha sp. PMI_526]
MGCASPMFVSIGGRSCSTCPTFWAIIPITNVRWTEELLVRSKNALLKVYLCPLFNPIPDHPRSASPWALLQLALHERDRISQLFIFVPESHPFRNLERAITKAFLHSPFPQLRMVQFTATHFSESAWAPTGPRNPPVKFLRRIHEWLPQQLCSLRLCGVSTSKVCSLLRSNITRLELTDQGRYNERPSVGLLFRLLRTLPLLEHLILRCSILNEPDDSALGPCVHHSLKSLIIDTVDTTLITSAIFLQHLKASSNLNITVIGYFLRTWLGDQPGHGDVDVLRESLAHILRTLFSSISPYLEPSNHGSDRFSTPRRQAFSSTLIEANSWGCSILLSRNGKLDLESCSPWGGLEHGNPWTYQPRLGTSDIRIELLDLLLPNDTGYVLQGVIPENGARLDAASVIFPFTLDLVQESEHLFLSETQDCQLGTSELSVIPWVKALSSATGLRELDLRVSEQTLQTVQAILDGWKEDGQTTKRIALPSLESMTFWEHRFLNQDRSMSLGSNPIHGHSQELNSSPTMVHAWLSADTAPHVLTTYILDPCVSPTTTQSSSPRKLIHNLAERKKFGHPLRNLSFRICSNFPRDILAEYEKFVDHVSWDMEEHQIWELPIYDPTGDWGGPIVTLDPEDSDSQDEYN